ncbi:MAG: ABC transporter permease [Azoarcus sp.]|jgi:putative ABC transport system permease protein|nr:ABC transporter permease [Azoarcus sp.]
MNPSDTLRFAVRAAFSHPLRSSLLVLAMSIGMAAVVILTALGDGMRNYIVGQFVSLGSNLIIVMPGRTETGGLKLGSFATNTPRDLTIEDANSLQRVDHVRRVAPVSAGNTEVAANGRLREVMVIGTTANYIDIRRFSISQGRFLPDEDWNRSGYVAVIGSTLQNELFGDKSPIGQMIRVGDNRLRIIGVLSPAGQGLESNTDELVIVPVATSLAIFNTNTLLHILIETIDRDTIEPVKAKLEQIIRTRHTGELDVTLITQDAVLSTFDRILSATTMGLVGIAAISLVVAGILVMNVMLVAVTQRTAEIGLLKALGASNRSIMHLFITEATLLSLMGTLSGFILGHLGAWSIRLNWPILPAWPPAWAVAAALGVALCSGLVFGVMPAQRAAALDPVLALTGH